MQSSSVVVSVVESCWGCGEEEQPVVEEEVAVVVRPRAEACCFTSTNTSPVQPTSASSSS